MIEIGNLIDFIQFQQVKFVWYRLFEARKNIIPILVVFETLNEQFDHFSTSFLTT